MNCTRPTTPARFAAGIGHISANFIKEKADERHNPHAGAERRPGGGNRDDPARTRDHGIPGAPVSRDRKGNLSPPAEGSMHLAPKALEQPQLSSISDRVAAWKGTDRQVETDGLRKAGQDPDARGPIDSALDAADLGMRDADPLADDLLAQTARTPGFAYLATDRREHPVRIAIRAVDRVLSRSHPRRSSLQSISGDFPRSRRGTVGCAPSVHYDRTPGAGVLRLFARRAGRPEVCPDPVVSFFPCTEPVSGAPIPLVPLARRTTLQTPAGAEAVA
jgi:hypothetical protein